MFSPIDNLHQVMEAKYTQIITESPLMVHSIKADLTPALSRLNAVVFQEVEQAVAEEVPECKDWASVNMYFTLAQMVAKITGRIFVGTCLKPQMH